MTPVAALLPMLSLLKWPLTVTGAVLVFGLSTEGTLSLVSSNAHKLTRPVAARTNLNMPPVRQIGELSPPSAIIDATPPATIAVALRQPESSIVNVAPPPVAETPAASDLAVGHIGRSAVNVRSGPSKNAAKLGVLGAGAEIRIGESSGGWVHVSYAGGEGWVYSSYLATRDSPSITVQRRTAPATTAQSSVIEIGSRFSARETPDGSALSLFRLQPGERVKVVQREGNWLKVETVSGDTGWIKAR